MPLDRKTKAPPKISINLLRWKTPWNEIEACIQAVIASDFDDYELIYMENADAGAPTLIDSVLHAFGEHPHVRVINNHKNLGYAGGHNKFFAETESELLMVLNPDAILDKTFLKNIVLAFDDPRVGAATGKMIKPRKTGEKGVILDGTGITMDRSRSDHERGQLELDVCQYDKMTSVFGVSGTAAVYRKTALDSVCLNETEYFDTDFFAYREDVDLSWRLRLQGHHCVYVPTAIVEHIRAVGVSPTGMRDFPQYLHHRWSIPPNIRRLSWRNHIFAIIKNDFGWPFYRDLPRILLRELGMLAFIVVFSPSTLLAVPSLVRLFPRMLRKRRMIRAKRVLRAEEANSLFSIT